MTPPRRVSTTCTPSLQHRKSRSSSNSTSKVVCLYLLNRTCSAMPGTKDHTQWLGTSTVEPVLLHARQRLWSTFRSLVEQVLDLNAMYDRRSERFELRVRLQFRRHLPKSWVYAGNMRPSFLRCRRFTRDLTRIRIIRIRQR